MDLRIVDDERLDPPRKVPLSWPYVRNSVGEWEYEWGGLVPGARDLRISDRFSFALENGKVLVPAEVWRREPVLSWCAAYWDPRGPKEDVLRVPIAAWIAHDEVVGMTAPELTFPHLLDTKAVADRLGTSTRTVAAYLARGFLPKPIGKIGGSPVWPEPLIRHYVETRPGKRGRPSRNAGGLLEISTGWRNKEENQAGRGEVVLGEGSD